MGIDIIWRDAAGHQVDFAGDSDEMLSKVIQRIRDDRELRHLLLATVDPYGTTTFAPPQIATLLKELQSIREKSGSVEERIALGPFLAILRAAEGAAGELVEFEGD